MGHEVEFCSQHFNTLEDTLSNASDFLLEYANYILKINFLGALTAPQVW